MKSLIVGIVIGAVITSVAGWLIMPTQMIKEQQSPMGFEETVAHLEKNVANGGWKVSAIMRLDKSLAKEGKTVLPGASFKICKPDYGEKVLKDDDARFLSVMMPCSIAVYEKTDGKTYISTMNAGLMGRMFGGTAAEVMAGPVAKETGEFVQFAK